MDKKQNQGKNLFLVLVFLFLYLPIGVLILYSFNDSKLNILFEGFTLDWYQSLSQNDTLLESFQNTFIITIINVVVSTVIGTISAVGLKKFSFPGKKLLNQLLYIPVVIPEIVLGISLLSMYTLVHFNLGLPTIIISHIVFSIPYVIISVRGVLNDIPASLEEASADLGASDFRTFLEITLPSIMPGIMSGAMIALTLSLDDVVISYFTAGPGSNTLPLYIYSMIKIGITPDVNALTTLLLLGFALVMTILTCFQIRKMGKKEYS